MYRRPCLPSGFSTCMEQPMGRAIGERQWGPWIPNNYAKPNGLIIGPQNHHLALNIFPWRPLGNSLPSSVRNALWLTTFRRELNTTFPVVVWQWLGDRDCTAQYNYCLPATTDCRRFCLFCLNLYDVPAMSLTWQCHLNQYIITYLLTYLGDWIQCSRPILCVMTWQVRSTACRQSRSTPTPVEHGHFLGRGQQRSAIN